MIALDDDSIAAQLGIETEADLEAFCRDAGMRPCLIKSWWQFWARSAQRPPHGHWRVWLIRAGRGFGKTRAGAEWVRSIATANPDARIALVGATLDEVRSVMVEGPSGLLAISPPHEQLLWSPALKRLRWGNGAQARLFSAAEPDSLRGPEHHFAWADEIAKWSDGVNAWDNLMLGMRKGAHPRVVATTTPKPVALLRRLAAETGVITHTGRTQDNARNLPEAFITAMEALYGGKRLGRQELDGEMIVEYEGALWSRALIEARRVAVHPALRRVVVGVDPPAGTSSGEGGDACGIVAVGLGVDGFAYVIEDASVAAATPEIWARAVADCCARVGADKVIAEANNGGQMVASVLQAADMAMPVRLVHASRGKVARAEPVATLYTNQRAFHAGAFPALEDELCGLVVGGAYQGPGRSPDRADALVWAMTELMLGTRRGEPRVRVL